MKNITSFLFNCIVITVCYSQTPAAFDKQKCFGGSSDDGFNYIQNTIDNGFIAIGTTGSNDGDASGNHGNVNSTDIWIVKLDSLWNIEWQKCFGGTFYDNSEKIIQTLDGGYIFTCFNSVNNGDFSGLNYKGGYDLVVVKLNALGSTEWKKCYGGTKDDIGVDVLLDNNGGFYILGQTNSSDGDVSGLHNGISNSSNQPSKDIWLLKLDAIGNLVWQKCFGGTKDENPKSFEITSSGGVIILSDSNSNDGDVTGNHSGSSSGSGNINDLWICKIDSIGNLQLQKCFGGSNNENGTIIQNTIDGNYILSSMSYSNDGDLSNFNLQNPISWIVKIDSVANIIWHKNYHFPQITLPKTYSINSSEYIYLTDYFDGVSWNVDIVKLNGFGDSVSHKDFGGSNSDYGNSFIQTQDGNFIISGYTKSNDGDIIGNHGQSDAWLVNLLDCNNSTNSEFTINQTTANSYSLNGQIYTQSGTYTQVLQNSIGCDSIITLNLTISSSGLGELTSAKISIAPNPTTSLTTLTVSQEFIGKSFSITDFAGRIVLQGKIQSMNQTIDLQRVAKGSYLLTVENTNLSGFKIIKE